ncbi:GntR family transcriptional regulator [Paremcibacter congregatus]|nr:GntR family transcriptional regulator [Paremcibacter congregatus]QDE27787.1 GntR family transcriptional regulator [Paremcibacter congregatus]
MASKQALSGDDIYRHIQESVLEQRLMPGTRMAEEALCTIYGTGRATIRKVLVMLAEDQIVTLERNKGAVIASPTVDEARQVFEARQALEISLLDWAMQRATASDIKKLYAHIERERAALRQGNIGEWVRLSGEFHLVLAKSARNEVFFCFLEKLVFRTSLIVGLYGKAAAVNCCVDDHVHLVQALEKADQVTGRALLIEHLGHIEERLVFTDPGGDEDLYRALSPSLIKRKAS